MSLVKASQLSISKIIAPAGISTRRWNLKEASQLSLSIYTYKNGSYKKASFLCKKKPAFLQK